MIKILNISFYYYILFSFVFSSSIKVTKGMKYVSLSKEKIPLPASNSVSKRRTAMPLLSQKIPWMVQLIVS